MRTAIEKSQSHTNSTVSRQVYVHVLLVQHLYSVFFQYDSVWSNIRNSLDAQKQKKMI